MLRLIDDENLAAVRAALPKRPYYSFLASHHSMSSLVHTVMPRLHDALASTALEWYVLALCSQISEFVGGRLIGSLAAQAALNSRTMLSSERDESSFLYCVCWHDASYLPAYAKLTRTAQSSSYSLACRLVERAFKHGDTRTLAAAIDRLSFYAPAIWDGSHPLLEYHVALARYNFLNNKSVDVPHLLKVIDEHGNNFHKRIFINELCAFLDLQPETVVSLCKSAAPRAANLRPGESDTETPPVTGPDSSLLGGI